MKKQPLKDAIAYYDSVIEHQFPYLDIPSISIAVRHKGGLVYQKALGSSDIDQQRDATINTPYRVASNSKMFTAVSLLQLQEQGKLHLDDPVIEYLPWLKEHKDTHWHEVTIRQVLSHTAGIARDSSRSGFWHLQYPFPDATEVRSTVLKDSLVYEPNTAMKYSNYGFGMLGEIIEKLSGKSFHTYIKLHIVQPLKLAHTYADLSSENRDDLAVGYTPKTKNGKRIPIDHSNTRALASATGLVSTPSDMTLFISDILGEKSKILSIQSSHEMRRIHAKSKYERGLGNYYGLGLEIGETKRGTMIYGHGGGFPGQLTHTRYDPDSELAVTVIINGYGIAPGMIASSLMAAMTWFSDNYSDAPDRDLSRFSLRYETLWGVNDIIGYGNKIIGIHNNFPLDFERAETYKFINDTTLLRSDTGSYLAPDEHLRYVFADDGSIKQIDDAGSVFIPIGKGVSFEDLQRIGLPTE